MSLKDSSKESNATPELRFPEFDDDWVIKKIGDIANIKRGASPRPISSPEWFSDSSTIGWVRISDVSKSYKYLERTTQYLSEKGVLKSRYIRSGSLIMSICATIGKPIYTKFEVCIHDGFVVFEDLKGYSEYLFYYLQKIEKKWYRYGQPGTQVNLNSDIITNEKLPYPSLPEQTKIAAFLSKVDEKIGKQQSLIEQLEQLKKGYMQQIFSQELRFPEFYDMWEEKRLGDVVIFSKGKGISKNDIEPSGQTKCIRYGELYTIYGEIISSVVSRTNIPKESLVLSEINDIIIPSSGETQIDIATASCILKKNIAIGGDLNILKTKQNGIYLSYYLNNAKRFLIARLSQGSSVIHLYASQLVGLKINIPSLPEQTKIADFLSALGKKIEVAQQQLKTTQTLKKALLQKMFV